MQNYTGHGWEGKEYAKTGYISSSELTKIIRTKLKELIPNCKFSISKQDYSGGRRISIALMEAPFEVFDKSHNADKNGNIYDPRSYEYAQLNHYTARKDDDGYNNGYYLTGEARKALQVAVKVSDDFNYCDSDGMIDYFSTNFYLHLSIGKWDKPFKKLERNQIMVKSNQSKRSEAAKFHGSIGGKKSVESRFKGKSKAEISEMMDFVRMTQDFVNGLNDEVNPEPRH